MRQIVAGAVVLIAGIAAFIEARSHRPNHICPRAEGCEAGESVRVGLSQTAYNILHSC